MAGNDEEAQSYKWSIATHNTKDKTLLTTFSALILAEALKIAHSSPTSAQFSIQTLEHFGSLPAANDAFNIIWQEKAFNHETLIALTNEIHQELQAQGFDAALNDVRNALETMDINKMHAELRSSLEATDAISQFDLNDPQAELTEETPAEAETAVDENLATEETQTNEEGTGGGEEGENPASDTEGAAGGDDAAAAAEDEGGGAGGAIAALLGLGGIAGGIAAGTSGGGGDDSSAASNGGATNTPFPNPFAPTITSIATPTANENQTFAVNVEATDDFDTEGAGLTYEITGGADAGAFNINTNNGELNFINAPDFENPTDSNTDNDYEVQITVTDSLGLTDVQDIVVTVNDLPEGNPPIITSDGGGATAAVSIDENTTAVTDVDSSDDIDSEGAGLIYSLTGGTDASAFNIDANTGVLTFVNAPDFENPTDDNMDNVYEVQVTVSDSDGLTDVQDIAVTVTNLDPEPPVIVSSPTPSAAENQTFAIDVESIDDFDTEGAGLTYAITGGADASAFNIDTNSGVLTFINAPDFEIPTDDNTDNDYEVQVTVTDSDGLTDVQDMVVTVNNVVDTNPPTIISGDSPSISENQSLAIDVESIDDFDSEGAGLTYIITGGIDAAQFSIDANTGELSFNTPPDFENPTDDNMDNVYEVQVTVSDSDGLTDVQDIAVTVTDLDPEPPVIVSSPTPSAAENQTFAIDVESTDEIDAEGAGLTYAITGGTDASAFNIDTNTGVLTFINAPDFENPTDDNTDNNYEVQVTVTDSDLFTDVQDLTITVTDVNEAPTITSNVAVPVDENQTAVIDIESTDPEGDTEGAGLTYAITGGADASAFNIDTNSGVLTFISAPDFEIPTDDNTDNDYEVQVTVTDSGGLADVQDMVVTVNNVVDTNPPTIISGDSPSISENQSLAIDVESIDDFDSEGAGLTYIITGGIDAAQFSIDANTGELSFNTPPDFENPTDDNMDNVYEVQVTVSDSDGLTDVQDISVTVTDILNDIPPTITFPVIPNFETPLNLSTLDVNTGFIINGINPSDEAGISVSNAGDVNGDSIDDIIIGAFGADVNGDYSGESYVVFGSNTGFSNPLELSSLNGNTGFTINGINGSYSGVAVSSAGDLNGDGIDDLVIGASRANPNGSNSGQTYVVFGRDTGFPVSLELGNLNATDGLTINGITAGDYSGSRVSGAGDINGDGINDFLIGAPSASPNGNNSGQTYVVFGSSTGLPSTLELSSLNGTNGFAINGVNPDDFSGSSVDGIGDINGDGIDDLIIGAPFADPSGRSAAGESYVVFGRDANINPFSASFELSTINGSNGFIIAGIGTNDFSGIVSRAGDINGDGFDDIIIGTSGVDVNQAYVIFGRATSNFTTTLELSALDGTDGFVINGIDPSDRAGYSVSAAGDVNGDGIDDLIITATSADGGGNNRGETYILFGNTAGFGASFNLSSINGVNGILINGIANDDAIGDSVSGGGDINGDGIDDVIIGARFADPNGVSSGQAYVVFGSNDALITITENLANVVDFNSIDDIDFEGGNLVYSITGGNDAASFNIDSSSGLLSFITPPDFENPSDANTDNVYEVEVTVTDSDNLIDTQSIRISITDTNDPPVITSNGGGPTANIDANENQIFVTDVDGIDQDGDTENGGGLVFSITGGADQALFFIDSDNGVLTFIDRPNFEIPTDSNLDNDYEVQVTVTDSGGLTVTQDITVTVIDADDPPVITSPTIIPGGEFTTSLNLSDLDGNIGFTINGIAATNLAGRAVSAAGDFNGDGIDDVIIGAPGTNSNDIDSGQSYIVFGSTTPFTTPLELSTINGTNGVVINGINIGDYSGSSVSNAGDINGDGIDDIIIGAFGADSNGSDSGQTYVVFGSNTLFTSPIELSSLDGTTGFTINGKIMGDSSGSAIRSAGDVNNDGFDDIIIGAPLADPNNLSSGQSYIVFGSANPAATLELSALDGTNGFKINGVSGSDLSGIAVSGIGDFNGDDFDDFVIGAIGADPNGAESGQTYVIFGSANPAAILELSTLDGNNGFTINGINTLDYSGESVSSAGDINGDGLDDLIIGASNASLSGNSVGQSYIVFGSTTPFDPTFELTSLDGTNGFTISGISEGDNLGFSVSAAGDVNSDGIDDLIIGAYTANGAGQSYIIFGSTTGFLPNLDLSLNLFNAVDSVGFAINGINSNDFSGIAVSNVGDINGDGIDDVIIGASGADPNGVESGQSYIVFGRGSVIPVDENQTVVTDVDSTDENGDTENGGGLTYAITGGLDQALFTIDTDTGVLEFLNAPDFETPGDSDGNNEYHVQITVTDSDLLTDVQNITVIVNNLNDEAPTITSPSNFNSPIDPNNLNGSNGFIINGGASDTSVGGVVNMGDINNDGFSDLLVGAPQNGNANQGSAFIVFGSANVGGSGTFDLDTLNGTNGFEINNPNVTGLAFGRVGTPGDINGDNIDDLIISAPGNGTSSSGETYIIFGGTVLNSTGGNLDLNTLNGTNGFIVNGAAANDASGASVSSGDINGDGTDDLVIGAPGINTLNSNYVGITYVVFGGAGVGNTGTVDLATLNGTNGFTFTGTVTAEHVGSSVNATGDFNGDNINDIIIGAPNITGAPGNAYVIFGSNTGFNTNITPNDLDGNNGFVINGINNDDAAGFSVSNAGDVNGDGIDDLIIGAPDADSGTGQSYVIFGTNSGFPTSLDLDSLNGTNGFSITGVTFSAPGGGAGVAVSGIGDVDGDGVDDLLIGAPSANTSVGNGAGQSYVVFGSQGIGKNGNIDLSGLIDATGIVIDGTGASNYSGISVGGTDNTMDVNGDGIADFIIGARETPATSGQAFVIFGKAATEISIIENQTDVIDINSIEPEGDTEGAGLTYAISGGADAGFFSLDSSTGELSFLNAPDHETVLDSDTNNDYEVQVTVTDSGGMSDMLNVIVTIEDDPNA